MEKEAENNSKINDNQTSTGLNENIEALLSYILGWITGIVFLIIEKKSKFVRFHAMQSTIAFLGLNIISIILGFIPLIGWLFEPFVFLIGLITWIVCMVKAYKGEKFKLPVVGNFVEKNVK